LPGTVRIEDNNLVLELHGVDEILSIKRSFHIPLKNIQSVSTDEASWAALKTLKLGGADFPGHIKDGWFFIPNEGIVFFEMHHPDSCITINLDHERYKKIIFEVEDKESAAMLIEEAISNEQVSSSGDENLAE
jgi:hypothetical protein